LHTLPQFTDGAGEERGSQRLTHLLKQAPSGRTLAAI
jgi:hypothetical protein